jgi:hypothetical protein
MVRRMDSRRPPAHATAPRQMQCDAGDSHLEGLRATLSMEAITARSASKEKGFIRVRAEAVADGLGSVPPPLVKMTVNEGIRDCANSASVVPDMSGNASSVSRISIGSDARSERAARASLDGVARYPLERSISTVGSRTDSSCSHTNILKARGDGASGAAGAGRSGYKLVGRPAFLSVALVST